MSIFDNCIIQAPDGQNLSRCGKKKVKWYLNQELAHLINEEDPTIIRLNFEPSGREGVNDPLLIDGKPNICVVCGTDEDLTRHHIVPYSFIKYMPVECKVDIIRDIFPLCETCHNEYEKYSMDKRLELAEEMGIDVSGISVEEARRTHHAIGAAAALLKYKDKIPEEKQKKLWGKVREFLGKEDVSEEDLRQLHGHKVTERPDYVNFSKRVANAVEDYSEFARGWREHFVETTHPKYMPKVWKTDRKTENVWVPKRMLSQPHPCFQD